MPRVKFDYVVSFSSEDPDNQANNLLAAEVSKKKWLCAEGEPSCSVVLQMSKAVKISAVQIGGYQTSLVEVLVGRSETPNEPFQVLVASNVFLSPSECRREQAAERVRSFTGDQLSSLARDQRWDRLRVVCSQPYNKHCKYGLSFVHVFEPEGAEAARCPPAPALPSRLFNLDTFSSDEDDFSPGELFAKHLQNSQDSECGISTSTEGQIRQATSQALRNIPDSASKLKKTPLPKPTKPCNLNSDGTTANRHRNSLLYDDDDEKPNSKVDRVIQQHSQNKKDDDLAKLNKTLPKDNKMKTKPDSDSKVKQQDRHKNLEHKPDSVEKPTTNTNSKREENKPTDEKKEQANEIKKRKYSDTKKDSKKGGVGVQAAPHELLRGAVLVFSGYVNPRRSALRTTALALGATCKPDWDASCTHLICAFPNTPKLRQVRATAGGRGRVVPVVPVVPVVRAEWLEQCAERRRLLPWRWFATEDHHRVPPTQHEHDPNTTSECDTDDEIEKVLQKQKKQRVHSSPERTHSSPDRPRDRSRDRRPPDEEEGAATEPDTDLEDSLQIDESKALPDFFEGLTFVMSREVPREAERYVRAYGGLLLDEVQVSEGCEPDYTVGEGEGGAPLGWLWRCHAEQRLCPLDE